MTDNVISAFGGRKPSEPSREIIESLERLLEQAKSGDLVGFAYATVRENGTQATGWDGEAGSRHPLGTSIMMLNHRYAVALLVDK